MAQLHRSGVVGDRIRRRHPRVAQRGTVQGDLTGQHHHRDVLTPDVAGRAAPGPRPSRQRADHLAVQRLVIQPSLTGDDELAAPISSASPARPTITAGPGSRRRRVVQHSGAVPLRLERGSLTVGGPPQSMPARSLRAFDVYGRRRRPSRSKTRAARRRPPRRSTRGGDQFDAGQHVVAASSPPSASAMTRPRQPCRRATTIAANPGDGVVRAGHPSRLGREIDRCIPGRSTAEVTWQT